MDWEADKNSYWLRGDCFLISMAEMKRFKQEDRKGKVIATAEEQNTTTTTTTIGYKLLGGQ